MAIVACAECNWVVSPTAAKCHHCGAPISVANPPAPPEEPPPPPVAYGRVVTGGVALASVLTVAAFVSSDRRDTVTRIASTWPGASIVPDTYSLASETIPMPGCGHDWRACADNRDWARSGDWTEAQGACLSLAYGAARLGQITWDNPWNGPRFDSYVPGRSIRQGTIVLVDRGALAHDGFGGWVRGPLHCTFDFATGRVRDLAPP